ncbi:hypothetical protein DBR47_15180 [Paucibacter sp. KBW04]|nr:hypothetical protein DBR47_15180 [Paucibacter sp. KBW04]
MAAIKALASMLPALPERSIFGRLKHRTEASLAFLPDCLAARVLIFFTWPVRYPHPAGWLFHA